MSLRFLTAGESHGRALVGILEGMPAGLEIKATDIHAQMKRRKLGFGRGARQKMEDDSVEILSGIRFGKTLGSPIALMVTNQDWKNWADVMQVEPGHSDTEIIRKQVRVPRPGHADLVGGIKYGHEDMRNVLERASARETAMRVALASVVRKFLMEFGIQIASRVTRIGSVEDSTPMDISIGALNEITDFSPVRCLGKSKEAQMVELIEKAKKEGDTLGGTFEVHVSDLPIGLGSYVQWDRRLEGDIAKAFMSLNAVKGVEIGLGFGAAKETGSRVHDEYYPGSKGEIRYKTNRSGGIDGGMSTGQPIRVQVALKPLSTLMSPLQSINLATGEAQLAHVERSDVTAVPAAAVIAESLLALVIGEAILEKFGGDSMEEIRPRVEAWKKK